MAIVFVIVAAFVKKTGRSGTTGSLLRDNSIICAWKAFVDEGAERAAKRRETSGLEKGEEERSELHSQI